MPGTMSAASGSGPWPSSQADTASYASWARLRTRARWMWLRRSAPSGANTISVTVAMRSWCGLSEVRSVLSFSGSIGKMRAEV